MNKTTVEQIVNPDLKHAFVFAHQDDELGYSGLISRLAKNANCLWVTNGDGLAPFVNADPEEYAQLRINECIEVRKILGVPLENTEDLRHSEIAIYDHFVEYKLKNKSEDEILAFFEPIARGVFDWLKDVKPDVVYSLAYQGGHPEHDIVSAFAGLAAKRLAAVQSREIKLVHLPEYEFTILIPMRFKPWYKGEILSIQLTPDELDKKFRVMQAYPSQVELFDKFKKVMNGLGKVSWLVGKKFSWEEFGAKETFGPTPLDFDYLKNPHLFELENYMMDKHKNIQIEFKSMIAKIVGGLAPRIEQWK